MKFYTRRRVSPVITIVSLVDILTMVLMFFVYTTTFKTQQRQIDINLPTVKSASDKQAETAPTILNVTKSGELILGDKTIQLADLGPAVKKLEQSNGSLALKADTEAPFGKIMNVLDELKIAGVENLPAFTQGGK